MLKFVINQDRDLIVKVEDIHEYCIIPVYYISKIIAFNLFYGEILLGTFDTVMECSIEMCRLLVTTSQIVFVCGYFSN